MKSTIASRRQRFEPLDESPNFLENEMKRGVVDIHEDPKDIKLYHEIWEADECLETETGGETAFRVVSAVILLLRNGQTDGVHHKQWVIDQALRELLTDEAYEKLTDENWEKGKAP
jgi:hypothetical protein